MPKAILSVFKTTAELFGNRFRKNDFYGEGEDGDTPFFVLGKTCAVFMFVIPWCQYIYHGEEEKNG